jgi:hypothetical protein
MERPVRSLVHAVVVTFGVTVVLMVASTLAPRFGWNGWYVPGDVWPLLRGSGFIADGALGYYYEAQPMPALPFFAILLAPFYALGRAHQLTESYPYFVGRPTMWLLIGPVATMLCAPLVYAARRLSIELRGRATWRTDVVAVVVGIVPCFHAGHFEDALATAFLLLALTRAARRQVLESAFLVSLAIGFKFVVVMALPVFVLGAWRVRRGRSIVIALALPGAMALFLLLVDYRDASASLLRTPVFPIKGYHHGQPWIDYHQEVLTPTAARLAWGLLACGIGWVALHRKEWTPTAATASVLLLRAVTDPVLYPYYLAPGLVLGLLVAPGGWVAPRASVAALVTFAWHPSPWLWWAVELLLLVPVAVGFLKVRDPDHHASTNEPVAGTEEQSLDANRGSSRSPIARSQ